MSEARVLIYSHDTFGLGHLRRCRAIAHALVEHDKDLSVLILSGSPIIVTCGQQEQDRCQGERKALSSIRHTSPL